MSAATCSPAGRDFAGARRRAPRSTAVIALVVGIVLCVAAVATIDNWAQWVVLGVIVVFTVALMVAIGPNRKGSGSSFKVGR